MRAEEPAQTIHPNQVAKSLSPGISTQGGLSPPDPPLPTLHKSSKTGDQIRHCPKVPAYFSLDLLP